MSYESQLKAEAATWCIEDPGARAEKAQRERMRHPKMIRDLLLDKLETSTMRVLEIGGGPLPLSDLLPFRERVVVDPLTEEYAVYFPVPDHLGIRAEEINEDAAPFDLVICTNALDHVKDWHAVVSKVERVLAPGGFFAVVCAENNALTNPHPSHEINLTADDLHRACDVWGETAWELTYPRDGYRYGWAQYEGRRGQPAFALLFRKCTGYDDDLLMEPATLPPLPAVAVFDDDQTADRLMRAFCDPGAVTPRLDLDQSEPEPLYAWQRRAVKQTITSIWGGV